MACDEDCFNKYKPVIVVGLILVGLTVLLVAISFSGVEYYEYGFQRQKSTGTVKLDQVYDGGKYLVGPDWEFKVFRADAHFEELKDIAIFTADKLEVTLTASFQYFLRKDELATLHAEYDLYYAPIMKTSAQDALKGAAPVFTTREYIGNRSKVETALFKAVRERLGGKCCKKGCDAAGSCVSGCKPYATCTTTDQGLHADVNYFQLQEVTIPNDVESRFLQALTLQSDAEREYFIQEEQLVRKTTDAEVKKIKNTVNEVTQQASADAELILAKADANATAIIENARMQGLKILFDKVGFTVDQYKNTLDYLRSIRDMDSAHLTVDFQQMIVGPVKTP